MNDQMSLLIKQSKKGNQEALVRLISHHKDEYYRLAYTYLGNKHDAMDAIEDMTLIVLGKIKGLKKDEAYLSWTRTILVNCCKKLIRKRKKVVILESIEESGYEEDFSSRDQQMDLQKHFGKINTDQEEAIKLRYLMDYDIKTIARLLEVPEGTIKSRISIGLQKLKESLGDEQNERYS